MAAGRSISPLILAELYDNKSDDFVTQLLQASDGRPLKGLIERWKKDTSPFATRAKLRAIRESESNPTHRLIVKRLFKHADLTGDREVMAACLHRFDTLVRRRRHRRYLWQTREHIEVLKAPPAKRDEELFPTHATRSYVRRRAWRHYRRLGFRQPDVYVPAVSLALLQYTDADIPTGQALLDNWGLVHALFGKSPVLVFSSRHTNVRAGQPLSDLSPAPMFERLWSAPAAAEPLLNLVLSAQSRTVRVWSLAILRRHHGQRLATLSADSLLALLDHTDPDVATFAAALLSDSNIAAAFPLSTWLRLARTTNPTVLSAIIDAFRKHVTFDRLSIPDAVALATSPSVPAARLGLEVLESRPLKPTDADAVTSLAFAKSSAEAPRIARFALAFLNQPGLYLRSQIIAFFDSPLLPLRTAALASLRAISFSQREKVARYSKTDEGEQPTPSDKQPASAALPQANPAATDPLFWAALLESPYDDIRTALIAELQRRTALPGTGLAATTRLWATVLLNIHRGGRAKLTALRQLSDAIATHPDAAADLIPVLAIALRSVRAPEASHALAALIAALGKNPVLAADLERHLPELKLEVPA